MTHFYFFQSWRKHCCGGHYGKSKQPANKEQLSHKKLSLKEYMTSVCAQIETAKFQ